LSSHGSSPVISDRLESHGVTVSNAGGALEVRAAAYRLRLPSDRPFARFEDRAGNHWASLFLACSAHTRQHLDDTYTLEPPVIEPFEDGVRLTVNCASSAWRRKRLVFTCLADELRAHLELEGEGALTDLHYFGGYYSGHLRFGSGWITSGAGFQSIFNPEPYSGERRAIPASESTAIDAMGTSLPNRAHWFFTPAPLVYALTRSSVAGTRGNLESALGADQGGAPEPTTSSRVSPAQHSSDLPGGAWLGMGLLTKPGEHNFTGFHFDASEGAFSLRLAYEGQTRVSGAFSSPSVSFTFENKDPYAAIAAHTATLERLGYVNLEPRAQPAWWSRPIQCGWGAQCVLAGKTGARAPELARQEHYDAFLDTLEAQGLRAGTVVIDDKWSLEYGTCVADPAKWPDLRSWIDRRHASGQRVLLWWKAWDAEGLPPEQCVRNAAGVAVTTDPSNPAYEASLRTAVRRMLMEYDADGFKVDFSARTPSGPGLFRYGTEWGIELLHKLLWILFDEAKRAKPDALVMTHAANPYFVDVSDMIRLNDINTAQDVIAQMRHRTQVAKAACPNLLIDTDNWPQPSLESWRAYTAIQNELGVPSFYYATHVDSGEAFEPEDYALLRRVWEEAT
jgi:hypothetical protein